MQLSRFGVKTPLVGLASLLIVMAGIVHLVAAPAHWNHGPVHSLLLGLIGVLEILWGLAFLRRPSAARYRFGVVLAVAVITVWAITRWLYAPFGHYGPGPIDAVGVISKVLEGLGVAALVALAVSGFFYSERARRGAWRAVGALLAIALAVGWASYGMALAVEPMISRSQEQLHNDPSEDYPQDGHGDGDLHQGDRDRRGEFMDVLMRWLSWLGEQPHHH